MGVSTIKALLVSCALLPLSSAFVGSSFSAFSSPARLQLRCPATCAPIAVRGARGGLLGAIALAYKVEKGDDLKGGVGNKYTFTVTVAGDVTKDSYSELLTDACARAVEPLIAPAVHA
jgi:hypothetical protein